LVQVIPSEAEFARYRCRRCDARLKGRSSTSADNIPAAAVAVTALLMFLPALSLPFLRIQQLGHAHESTLIGGVIALLAEDEWIVGLVILAFSLVLPPLKLTAVLLLSLAPSRLRADVRGRTYRAVELVGRWGMLDVFLVAVLVAYVKLGDVVQFEAGAGLFAFATFVVLSLLAAYFFDPHALWNERPMANSSNGSPQQPKTTPQEAPSSDDVSQRPDKSSHSEGQSSSAADSRAATLQQTHVLPDARRKSGRRGSLWWLMPLVALLGISYLVYESWRQRGVDVHVNFADGHGLKAGDEVRYRGIVVGEVQQIDLGLRLDAVRATVRLKPSAARLAREGTRFWIVRPELSLTELAGIETVVGAKYLEVEPAAKPGPAQYHFVGLERRPLVDLLEAGGIRIVLQASDAFGLNAGSPLFYRKLRVGGVHEVTLAADGSAVEVHAYVRPGYRHLVRSETRFWKSGGMRFEGGLTGFALDMGSVGTLLQPGVAMAVPPEAGESVQDGYRFDLHEEPEDEWLEWKPSLAATSVPDVLPRPQRAVLQWTVPGYLYDAQEQRSGWTVPLGEALLGPADMLREPETAEVGSAQLLLAGHRFDIQQNVELAGPGIGQLDASLEGTSAVSVRLRAPEVPEDVLLVGESARAPVLVSATRLTGGANEWLIDEQINLDATWHGVPAVAARDGAVIGLLLLREQPQRIALYRPQWNTAQENASEE
jgi:hypothetical protein